MVEELTVYNQQANESQINLLRQGLTILQTLAYCGIFCSVWQSAPGYGLLFFICGLILGGVNFRLSTYIG
jgi:hypothetical protein